VRWLGSFVANVDFILALNVDISLKIKTIGFHVIPKHWERTFAWLNFEIQEAMIKISHTLLKRL